MSFPVPKNTFGIGKFSLSDEYLDFQRLIIGVHIAESRQRLGSVTRDIPVSEPDKFQSHVDDLEEFFEWLTDRPIHLNFITTTKKPKQERFEGGPHFDFVSLFSGGLDSASFPLIKENQSKRGFLHHTITSNRLLNVAKKVHKKCIPRQHKLVFTRLNLQSTANIPLLHIRGAIFLTNLLCIAAEHNINKVIVPENGPFMINYPVSMSVSPTRTADPALIDEWTKIFNNITGSKITVETPFFNMTKSEVILASNETKLIEHTWSCSTSQGISKMCGVCMACFVRILSLYAIDNGENLNKYQVNPFDIDEKALKDKRKISFRILFDCIEFWRNLIKPELSVNETERENYVNLIVRNPVMKNHALDMYLGMKKYFESHEIKKSLAIFAGRYIKEIDNKVLESRHSILEKQIKRFNE